MNFITLELDITEDPKIKLLMEKYKNALIVWIYLLIKFGKEEEKGFMIFLNKNWYKDFADEIKTSKTQVKEIIKEMANIGLINSNLFFEDILFSENFFKKHYRYFLRNKKDLNTIKEKILINLEFLFNSRKPNEMHIMEFEELKNYFLNLFIQKNNNLDNEITQEKIQNAKALSGFVQENQLNNQNENTNNNKNKVKIQFNHDSFEYMASIYLTNLLEIKDPNNKTLNKQDGARMFFSLTKKYSQEEILRALKYFGDELNKNYHNNLIDRIYSYWTFRQNIKGLISLSKTTKINDYYSRAEKIVEI